ncbi:MAG: hypothetical protein AMXMBFR13_06760 [Phycisphaerae bacterium]
MNGQTLVEQNRERGLYLLDRQVIAGGDIALHVYYIPRGWVDDFSKAAGFEWGPDATGPEDEDGPEVYCYAPNQNTKNPPVETLWIPVPDLERMEAITDARARELHPALFEVLERIDQGQT